MIPTVPRMRIPIVLAVVLVLTACASPTNPGTAQPSNPGASAPAQPAGPRILTVAMNAEPATFYGFTGEGGSGGGAGEVGQMIHSFLTRIDPTDNPQPDLVTE